MFSCQSIILLYILPQLIGQYFCVFTKEYLCSIFNALQLPEHPRGHIAVRALLYISVLRIYIASTNLVDVFRQCILDFL